MNNLIDLIKAVKSFTSKDVEHLLDEEDGLSILRSDSLAFFARATEEETSSLTQIEGSAESLLFLPTGLINPSAQATLIKHGMEMVKLPSDWHPIVYALKTEKFRIPIPI